MKVRVAYTVDVDDDYRRALCHQWGECGRKATRDEVRNHLALVGSSNDADIMQEWLDCEDCDDGRWGA